MHAAKVDFDPTGGRRQLREADPPKARDWAAEQRKFLDAIAPEDLPYTHTCEGPDDMPAHVKASLTGCSVTIPIRDGRLCLGIWQGIYLCEHRDRAGSRSLVVTVQGEPSTGAR